MNVYVIFKEGVYRKECGGVFSNLLDAVKEAINFRNNEPDNSHAYYVLPQTLDTPAQQVGKNFWDQSRDVGDIIEPQCYFVGTIIGYVSHDAYESLRLKLGLNDKDMEDLGLKSLARRYEYAYSSRIKPLHVV